MSATYSLEFLNQTSDQWKCALWWKFTSGGGGTSVIWMLENVPAQRSAEFEWRKDYGVLLGTVEGAGGSESVKPGPIQNAELGSAWQVIDQGNKQKIESAGSAQPETVIEIKNDSAESATPGLALGGRAATYYVGLLSHMTLSYSPGALSLFVGLYTDAKTGDEVREPSVGPVEVAFPPGEDKAVVTAVDDGSGIHLQVSTS